jgi:hypothetical protein
MGMVASQLNLIYRNDQGLDLVQRPTFFFKDEFMAVTIVLRR